MKGRLKDPDRRPRAVLTLALWAAAVSLGGSLVKVLAAFAAGP